MVQKSGEKTTWDGAETPKTMGEKTTNLNWFSRRIETPSVQ